MKKRGQRDKLDNKDKNKTKIERLCFAAAIDLLYEATTVMVYCYHLFKAFGPEKETRKPVSIACALLKQHV